jgi:hypothetical protein
MDNLEKTEEAIKNGQSRENRRGNQEWTIQRKPKEALRFYLTFICCSECKNKINNNNWLKKPSKDSPLRMKK